MSKRRIPSERRLKEVFADMRVDNIDRVREELERWRDTDQDAGTTMRKVRRLLGVESEVGVIQDGNGDELGQFILHDASNPEALTLVYRHDRGTMAMAVPGRLLLARNGALDVDEPPTEGDLPHVVSYYENWTPEDLEAGDTDDRGEHDDVTFMLDEYDIEEGLTLPDLVVKYLSGEGVSEASSSSFHKGVWYDTEPSQDFRTGETERRSYHLKSFSPEDEAAIYRMMMGKRA